MQHFILVINWKAIENEMNLKYLDFFASGKTHDYN